VSDEISKKTLRSGMCFKWNEVVNMLGVETVDACWTPPMDSISSES
jgi:hypothetical protein